MPKPKLAGALLIFMSFLGWRGLVFSYRRRRFAPATMGRQITRCDLRSAKRRTTTRIKPTFRGLSAAPLDMMNSQGKKMSVDINTISPNPSAIARALGLVAFFLVLASIGGQLSKFMLEHDYLKGFVPLFNVDNERNIPTFFSVLLMIFAALLLSLIAMLNSKRKAPHVQKWIVLSIGFIFMAYDEAFQVHELLTVPIRNFLGNSDLGVFYYAWVVPAIALIFILALYFLQFLLHLPAKNRFAFLLAATLYLGGCIGFGMIGANYCELHGKDNLTYSMVTAIEESLEMAGLIVFVYALLTYIADNYTALRFRFDKTI